MRVKWERGVRKFTEYYGDANMGIIIKTEEGGMGMALFSMFKKGSNITSIWPVERRMGVVLQYDTTTPQEHTV